MLLIKTDALQNDIVIKVKFTSSEIFRPLIMVTDIVRMHNHHPTWGEGGFCHSTKFLLAPFCQMMQKSKINSP